MIKVCKRQCSILNNEKIFIYNLNILEQSPEEVGQRAAEELIPNITHGGCVHRIIIKYTR